MAVRPVYVKNTCRIEKLINAAAGIKKMWALSKGSYCKELAKQETQSVPRKSIGFILWIQESYGFSICESNPDIGPLLDLNNIYGYIDKTVC